MAGDRFEKIDTAFDIALNAKSYQNWFYSNGNVEDGNYKRALRALPKVLEKLTDTQRTYLLGYITEDLTMDEIAKRHGRHKSAISRTIKRARQKLFDYMVLVSPEYADELDQFPERILHYHRKKGGT